MNNQRRKELNRIMNELEDMTATETFDAGQVESLKDDLQWVYDEEVEAFENMPEPLQDSERGLTSQEAQENLEMALEYLENALEEDCEDPLDALEDAATAIEDAAV